MSIPAARVVHVVTLDSVFQLIKAQRPTWLPSKLERSADSGWIWREYDDVTWSAISPELVVLALHGVVRIMGDQEACDVVVWQEDCQGETADSGPYSSQNDELETASFDGPADVANLAAYAHASGIRFGAPPVDGGGA